MEAMAQAVENSAAVILCVSKHYKDSVNCQKGKINSFNPPPLTHISFFLMWHYIPKPAVVASEKHYNMEEGHSSCGEMELHVKMFM